MRTAALLVLAAISSCPSTPTHGAAPASARSVVSKPAKDFDGLAPGSSIPDVGLPDASAGPFVVVVASSRCREMPDFAAGALRRAERFGRARGVRFVYLYADPRDTFDDVLDLHRRCGFQGPPIVAGAGRIARALGATHACETFVVGADGVLRYRGAVEPMGRDGLRSPVLIDALSAVLAGAPVARPTSFVPG